MIEMFAQRSAVLFSFLCLFCIAISSSAHASFFQGRSPVSADVFVVENSAEAGLTAGVRLEMEPGWHVYWQNPGDAGMPVEIKWDLPPGLKVFPLEFPYPERFDSGGMTGYGYNDEVVLFSRIVTEGKEDDLSVADRLFPLKAKLSWLSCKETCMPGSAEIVLTKQPVSEALLERAREFRRMVPVDRGAGKEPLLVAAVRLDEDRKGSVLRVDFAGRSAQSLRDFFPLSTPDGMALDRIAVRGNSVIIPYSDVLRPSVFSGVAVTKKGAYVVTVDTEGVSAETDKAADASLFLMLVFAFIGGILLNIMPCVLPVLGLKVFSLIGTDDSESGRAAGRFLSLVFASGVLLSFWFLAIVVLGFQAMGATIGWGFQFQSPAFVMFIAAVVFGFSLNLFGLFEIGTPAVSGKIGKVASHHDSLGAFVSGVLATTLATPCTAPFLGSALGFAFAQPAWIVFVFFTVIALGMAFPYVVLAWHPVWLRFLPKPGHWMYLFKQLMGFVLVGVVIWLASILNSQTGGQGLLRLFILLLVVAFVLWVLGNLTGHGASFRRQLLVWVLALVLMGGACYTLIFDAERSGAGGSHIENADPGAGRTDKNGVFWRDFSPALFDRLIEEKKTIFLDFTAEWCITCKVLEASVLSSRSVGEALLKPHVEAVRADWTTRDDAITTLLQRFGRSGVPLLVIIPRGDLEKAVILPEVLTVDMLLSAFRDAGI